MNVKYYWNLLRGKTKATKPAKLTFRNIYAVIQSWWRKKKMVMDGFNLDQHIYEQIIWRRTQVIEKSPACWNEGTCTVCGCEILGKTMEDRACEGDCYPYMMNEEQWKTHKILNNIKIFD